jgi:hypothetical protein
MATKVQYLTFNICLTDPDLVAQYQATQWIAALGNGAPVPLGIINVAPLGAEVQFAAPFRGFVDPAPQPPSNYIWTSWSGAGEEDGPFPLNVAVFQRHTGGFWGFGGQTTRYYWMGQFVYVPPATPPVPGQEAPPPVVPIAQVCWIESGQLPQTGEGAVNGGALGDLVNRDSSRTVDGYGLALRSDTNVVKRHLWTENGDTGPSIGWVRGYLRPRLYPTGASGRFFLATTSTSAEPAVVIELTPTGQLSVYRKIGASGLDLVGTSDVLAIGVWHRLDLLLKCGPNTSNPHASPSLDGQLRVYIDGALLLAVRMLTFDGLGGEGFNPKLAAVELGSAATINGMELDLADWSGHKAPFVQSTELAWTGDEVADPPVFCGQDWLNGSHAVRLVPKAFGAGHSADWAGDYRLLAMQPVQQGTSAVSATVAGAVLEVELDSEQQIDAYPGAIGCSAIVVGAYHNRASGAVALSAGISVAGGAFTDLTFQASTVFQWSNLPATLLYRPAGMIPRPVAVSPVTLHITKSADAVQVNVRALQAVALLLGQFGPEDAIAATAPGDPVPDVPVALGIHNAPYPRSPWATTQAAPPLSPVQVYAGTFVGNSLGQDLLFKSPPHWYWVRALTGAAGGGAWWSSMLGAHRDFDDAPRAEILVQALADPAFNGAPGDDIQSAQYLLRLAGEDTQGNVTGVTYAYVAVCDPGQRFMLNGAFAHRAAAATFENPLVDSGFTPEWGWFWPEKPGTTATDRRAFKGPGHAGDAYQLVNVASVAPSAIEFVAGLLRSKAAIHLADTAAVPYSLWRGDDGSEDPGIPKVVQIFAYTGDGNASRTLSVPRASGVRPLFAAIQGSNGVMVCRDPEHTTNTSTQLDGTSASTAITGGGVDQILLGATLNATGIVYNVFVLMGSATAGNGGWSIPGEFTPVDPDTAPGDQWGPEFPGEPGETGDGETPVDPGDLTTDIAAACLAASTRLVNQALANLGITARIASLATDESLEADAARVCYKTQLDATLRAFPWPFAKRMGALTLVGGTATVPVNGDWTYSYRPPADCIFVRRVVDPSTKRRYNPTPIAFELGADDTGDLVFTDEPGTYLQGDDPVVIEYTARVGCPASRGDAIFRDAAAWRLAAVLAKPLSRDAKDADRCMRNYLLSIGEARVVHRREQEEQQPTDGDPEWLRDR